MLGTNIHDINASIVYDTDIYHNVAWLHVKKKKSLTYSEKYRFAKFDIKRTNKIKQKILVFHCESCLSQMKCCGVMQSTRATLNPVFFSRARHPLCWLADIIPEKLDLVGSVALNCSKSIGCLLVTHFQCPWRSAEVPAVQNPEDVYPPEFEDKLSILDRVVLWVGQTKRDLEEYGLGVPYRDPKKYGLGVGGLIWTLVTSTTEIFLLGYVKNRT